MNDRIFYLFEFSLCTKFDTIFDWTCIIFIRKKNKLTHYIYDRYVSLKKEVMYHWIYLFKLDSNLNEKLKIKSSYKRNSIFIKNFKQIIHL